MTDTFMTLGQKQRIFAQLVGLLIHEAYERGYEVTLGEAWRTDEQAEINALGPGVRSAIADLISKVAPKLADLLRGKGGMVGKRDSVHRLRLAIDLNLFRDGVWLQNTEDHRELGEWWEKLHPLCRWGGRFNDGNHYSMEHSGRK